MSEYTDIRDAILDHAKAAALATDPKFTNVEVGWPYLNGAKGCRIYYAGEGEAPEMPFQSAINGDVLIGDHIALIAWWSVSNLADGLAKAIDTQMYTFKHELRGRIVGDQTLGGDAVGIVMDYAEPDTVVVGGTRYSLVGCDFTVGPIEYAA